VRALDDAGILVESLEVVEPSLDDVFVARTGHRLEPVTDGAGAEAAEASEGAPSS
jgi:hypothetical protein